MKRKEEKKKKKKKKKRRIERGVSQTLERQKKTTKDRKSVV